MQKIILKNLKKLIHPLKIKINLFLIKIIDTSFTTFIKTLMKINQCLKKNLKIILIFNFKMI